MSALTLTTHKKAGLIFLAALLVLLVVFTNVTVRASTSEDKAPALQAGKEDVFASLSGFQPGAFVSYRVYDPKKGTILTGKAQTDALGNLTLPMPAQFKNFRDTVTYDFLIDEQSQTLNIALSHNVETGDLSLEGSGTQGFTKIVIESEGKSFETHSDWAGLFEESAISHLWSEQDNPTYKVAFFSTNPAQDINALTRSPIIQIQTAQGGGGAGSSGVNNFTPGNCGTPIISFCNTSKMKQQIDDIIKNLVQPLQFMAEQLTVNAMYQAFSIGTFLDAKEQLEVQRDLQALVAEAHKDYHPSEQLCRFGSFVKSLAHTEQKMEHDTLSFNKIMMDHYLNKKSGATSFGSVSNPKIHLKKFREVYCDPADNSGGLNFLCEHDQDQNTANSTHRSAAPGGIGGDQIQRMNRDVDFLRTFDTRYTLEVDFTDNAISNDEEDVIALAKNLYWPTTYKTLKPKATLDNQTHYMTARRLLAMNNIAHNSFARQVAMKAQAPAAATGAAGGVPGWAHMKTMMRDFGLTDPEIEAMVGKRPSYYAQMDILTKKIYQSPHFYTNLYDKPANIDRTLAVLDSISLMQQRDHYESMMRHEMLASGLLQTALTPTIERLQAKFDTPKN